MRKSLPILALLVPAAASAQNLLANPGFEAANLAGWIAEKTYPSTFFHTGSFAANLSPGGGNLPTSEIRQSFSSTPGMCEVSFWLAVAQPSTGTFSVSFGESFSALKSYVSLTAPPASGYVRYSFTAPATGSRSILSFAVGGSLGSYLLDDVSVTPMPVLEPAPLAALGLGTVALMRRRRRK